MKNKSRCYPGFLHEDPTDLVMDSSPRYETFTCSGSVKQNQRCLSFVYRDYKGLTRNSHDDSLHTCGQAYGYIDHFSDGSPVLDYEDYMKQEQKGA